MNARQIKTRLTAVILALLLAGCSGSSVVPEDRFYRLAERPPARVLATPLLHGELAVAPFRGPALYRERALLFTAAAQPLQLQRHHYHHWIDSPPRLLQARLVQYLDASRLASRVVTESAATRPRYRLQGSIEAFEQLTGGSTPGVRVGLRLVLRDAASGRVLLDERFQRRSEVPSGAGIYASVEAFQSAVDAIYADWVERLAGLAAKGRLESLSAAPR
ncbi:ABC-type transport auxiliary lipoprotein family protein [Thiohalobacter sp. IOR34]|uniref:ABC-type transport auxiliary lipoprotein family protein n=1 Tax=Thiohalobacter sp. IOR34 TaxID=3057176 RepID=UPI0025B0C90F|nr:ABC-type transport auxiliary lipoprotein family protein [Thiohalobacter sp. IOR34]WJW74624.1 ABC-type transport auxiliary lipoprotein family protein [Thiohalobacter sp. IOR34]